MNQLIVCAAIRSPEGTIIAGVRHFDSIMRSQLKKTGAKHPQQWEQGFLDNRFNFFNRFDAYVIAHKAGQIRRQCGSGSYELFSEHLY